MLREQDCFIKAMVALKFRKEMIEILLEQHEYNGTKVAQALVNNKREVKDLTMHSMPDGILPLDPRPKPESPSFGNIARKDTQGPRDI